MKQLKTSLKHSMLLMAMVFMVTSCQKDDDNSLNFQQVQVNKTPQLTLQRLTNPDISNNSKLSEKLNAINQKRNEKNAGTMAREVYNPELDFTIDTSIANYISHGDYHSYTFPVSRTVDNGFLENVLLSLQADGTYIAYLISYDITEAERNLLLNNEQIPNLHDKMSSTVLLDQEWISNIFARGGGSCWDYYIYEPKCSYNQHTAAQVNGDNCEYVNDGGVIQPAYTVFIIIDCDGMNPGGDFPGDPENPGDDNGWPETGGDGPYDPNNPNPTPNEGDDCSDGLSTGFVDANGNCIPDTTAPIVKPVAAAIRIENCIGISVPWLHELENSLVVSQIDNYLALNQCSPEAQAFAEAVLDAGPDAEVDWEEGIIFDDTWEDFPCHRSVVHDAIGVCSPLTGVVQSVFENNDFVYLLLTSEILPSNNAETVLSGFFTSANSYYVKTRFNETYLNSATDLSIARTTIHESLHAIFVYMYEEGLLLSEDGSALEEYEDFVQAYINKLNELPYNFGTPGHEILAEFVDDIATSLSLYAQSVGYVNSFNYYRALAWGGLTGTEQFNTLYPTEVNGEINIERLKILNTIKAEALNENQYFEINGTTYEIIPKGIAPNQTQPCN